MKMSGLRVFVATILLYLFLFLAVDKIVAIALIIGFLIALYFMVNDVPSVLVVGYVALAPLPLGKLFPIDLVSAATLHLLDRPLGIAADIKVTTKDILVLMMGVGLLWQTIRGKPVGKPRDAFGWMLFLFPFVWLISAYEASLRVDISLLQTLFYFSPYIIYQFVVARRMNRDFVVAALCAVVVSECLLLIGQHLQGNMIGRLLEDFPGYVPIDLSAESHSLFRFGGTFAHANILAQYLLFSWFTTLPLLFSAVSLVGIMGVTVSFLGGIALLLTMSRSAWIAWMVGVALVIIWQKKMKLRVVLHESVRRVGGIAAIVAIIIALIVAWPRVRSTTHTFDPYGSGITRVLLMREAWELVRLHPVFGVGLGMDVYAMYLRSQRIHVPLSSYFPEPVHNGFVQLLLSTGIMGLVPYIVTLIVGWQTLIRGMVAASGEKKRYMAAVLAGFFASVINAQLQPILPDISLLALFIALLT